MFDAGSRSRRQDQHEEVRAGLERFELAELEGRARPSVVIGEPPSSAGWAFIHF